MQAYLDLLQDVLDNGETRSDRTGVGTISVFDRQLKFDLQKGFPAVTTKKLAFQAMMGELLWFMNGETSISDLKFRTFNDSHSEKPTIWDANQKAYFDKFHDTSDWSIHNYDDDDNGAIYGYQWRKRHGVDQLEMVINRIKKDPTSRRLLVSAWDIEYANNPGAGSLPPCHYAFQFYVREGMYLDLKFHMRSSDVFLGLPLNIASYAALCHIVAHMTGYEVGTLTADLGDTHIYLNHVDQVREQLTREPYPLPEFNLPQFIENLSDLEGLTASNFFLEGYEHHPTIKAPMAV